MIPLERVQEVDNIFDEFKGEFLLENNQIFYEFIEKLLLENEYFFFIKMLIFSADCFKFDILRSNDTFRGRRVTNFSPFCHDRFKGNLL